MVKCDRVPRMLRHHLKFYVRRRRENTYASMPPVCFCWLEVILKESEMLWIIRTRTKRKSSVTGRHWTVSIANFFRNPVTNCLISNCNTLNHISWRNFLLLESICMISWMVFLTSYLFERMYWVIKFVIIYRKYLNI